MIFHLAASEPRATTEGPQTMRSVVRKPIGPTVATLLVVGVPMAIAAGTPEAARSLSTVGVLLVSTMSS
jgi:hypothetical protein